MGYTLIIIIYEILYFCNGQPSKNIESPSVQDNFSGKIGNNRVNWKDQSEAQYFSNSKRQNDGIPQKTVKCNNDFIKKVSHLLDIVNISLPFNDIESARPSIKGKAENGGKLSGLHFAVILNMRQMYPEYGKEEFEKVYEANDPIPKMLLLSNFEKHTIDSTKLVITVNNIVHSNKSLIQIKMDINFVQDDVASDSRKMYSFSGGLGMLSNFFRNTRKWRRKKIKVEKFSSRSIFIGTALAIFSSILCGLSFAVKKWTLRKVRRGKSYYFDKNWWYGQSLMIIGDILHFMAFYFAPAIIVCTLQILTVIVTAVASSTILGERMHKYGKLAFALSISGCWVIVFHVPNEPHVYSIETYLYMLTDNIFLIYIAILSITSVLFTSFWIPIYGKSNSLAYTIQSAMYGSVTVLGIKGIVLGFTDTLSHWLPWMSLTVVTVLLILQLEYLNKALSMYNTLVVTTQYYVLYSSFVIFASSLLFKVWVTSSYETIFTNFCGFSIVGLGALILTIFEEENATFDFSRLLAGPEPKHMKL